MTEPPPDASPPDASGETPSAAGSQELRPFDPYRPTRREGRDGTVVAPDDDVVTVSPPCAMDAGGAGVELRVDRLEVGPDAERLRVSVKNCASNPRPMLGLRAGVFSGMTLAVSAEPDATTTIARATSGALRCADVSTLAPGEERLAGEAFLFRRGDHWEEGGKVVHSLPGPGPFRVRVRLAPVVTTCRSGSGRDEALPADLVRDLASAPRAIADAPPPKAVRFDCACPDTTWSVGGGRGDGAATMHVDRACKVTQTTTSYVHNTTIKQHCTSTLPCEGPHGERGASALASLVADPDVAGAFARDTMFRDGAAEAHESGSTVIEHGGHKITIGACYTCRTPPAVVALARFLDVDGMKPWLGPATTKTSCR